MHGMSRDRPRLFVPRPKRPQASCSSLQGAGHAVRGDRRNILCAERSKRPCPAGPRWWERASPCSRAGETKSAGAPTGLPNRRREGAGHLMENRALRSKSSGTMAKTTPGFSDRLSPVVGHGHAPPSSANDSNPATHASLASIACAAAVCAPLAEHRGGLPPARRQLGAGFPPGAAGEGCPCPLRPGAAGALFQAQTPGAVPARAPNANSLPWVHRRAAPTLTPPLGPTIPTAADTGRRTPQCHRPILPPESATLRPRCHRATTPFSSPSLLMRGPTVSPQ